MGNRELIVEDGVWSLSKLAGISGAFAVSVFLWVELIRLTMRLLSTG